MVPKGPRISFLDSRDLKQDLTAKIQNISEFFIFSYFLVTFGFGKSWKIIKKNNENDGFYDFFVENITKKYEKMKNS